MGKEISVVMATYYPVLEKCLFTLESVISQKNIDLELVIVDDGSADNLFCKIEGYLCENGFNRFKLIEHKENQGTVKNYFDGIKAASGKYVKLISPGDALFSEDTLSEWLDFINESGRRWSFAEAVFYLNEDGNKHIIEAPSLPRVVECYKNGIEETCRWNYVVLEDVALGAALLSERELLLQYLERFIGVSKYAEDVAFAAMMFDGILPAYFERKVIFYEYGTGVSTGEKKWIQKIKEDQRNAEKLIAAGEGGDELQNKMRQALIKVNSGSESQKKILRNLQKGGIGKVIKHRLNPRMSSVDIIGCGKWWDGI